MTVREGVILWQPSPERQARANLTRYRAYAEAAAGRSLPTYGDLWQWSVRDLEAFWQTVWEYSGLPLRRPFQRVLAGRAMPGARWFPGAELNYADGVFRHDRGGEPAVLAFSEAR